MNGHFCVSTRQDKDMSGVIFLGIIYHEDMSFSCRSTILSNNCMFKMFCTQRKLSVITDSDFVTTTLEPIKTMASLRQDRSDIIYGCMILNAEIKIPVIRTCYNSWLQKLVVVHAQQIIMHWLNCCPREHNI